ncbi:hypothetical protein [Cupriavidus necator]|uniref:hypothetical protein n=1 Tax=Cupriavidus necator TaxID=106590 RepID=UPI00339D6F3F
MQAEEKSLRSMVEKWLGCTLTSSLRVADVGRLRDCGSRFVRVESERVTGTLSIVFFRHGDGAWHVFPPMTGSRLQAYWASRA